MIWNSKKIIELVKIKNLFSLFNPSYEYGYDFAGEMHNFWECMYVIRGSVCVSADNRIHKLKKGEIIFHKPLELHKFYVDSDEGAELFIFSFDMDGSIEDKLLNKVVMLDDYQHQIMSFFIRYVKDRNLQYKNENITNFNGISHFSFKNNTFLQTVATYITNLILSISESENVASTVMDYDAVLFKNAVDLMNGFISDSLSVDEIAKALNVSQSTLKRIFTKYAGISVHKYYVTLKIKTATALLESGVSVSDTADKLGYVNQAYFSAVYKRETGNNPSKLKK